MKYSTKLILSLAAISVGSFQLVAQNKSISFDGKKKDIKQSENLFFTINKGQIADRNGSLRDDVLYQGQANGMNVFLRKTGVSYVFSDANHVLHEIHEEVEEMEHNGTLQGKTEQQWEDELMQKSTFGIQQLNMDFIGSNKNIIIQQYGPQQDLMNYYHEHCPGGIKNVKKYRKIKYNNVYPGIDFQFYGNGIGMEYDIIVQPNIDPNQIQLHWQGAEKISLDDKGTLILETKINDFKETIPKVYQNIEGEIIVVDAKYEIRHIKKGDAIVKIILASYDTDYPLIIDPWATYYGGSGNEWIRSIDTDVAGNVYVAGNTTSATAISFAGFQSVQAGSFGDAFLVKFDDSGVRIWGTYYGGSGTESGKGVTVDPFGDIYLTGEAQNSTTIASGGFQNTYGGGLNDAFLVKFDANGNRIWGTFYGDTGYDGAFGVATDPSGNVFISGYTNSASNISSGGFQNTFAGFLDAFLVKFDAAGNRLWATYYGGTEREMTTAIGTDLSGNVYVGLNTTSTAGISSGGHQNTYGGGTEDAFLVKFDAAGNRLWATYFGGAEEDKAFALKCDNIGNVYLAGETRSGTAMASGGFQNTHANTSSRDAFLVKFNSSGSHLWSTYLGDTEHDYARGLTVDMNDNHVYLSGDTYSSNFPTTPCALQTSLVGTENSFITHFYPNGDLYCSSYFGTNHEEDAVVAVYDCYVYLAGGSPTGLTTTTGAHQTVYAGGVTDAFLAQLNRNSCSMSVPPLSIDSSQVNSANCSSCTGSATVVVSQTCVIDAKYSYLWSTGVQLLDTSLTTHGITDLCPGDYWVEITSSCYQVDTVFYTITGIASPSTPFNQTVTICNGQSITIGTNTYNSSGNYSDTLLGVSACDSIVNTNLFVVAVLTNTVNNDLCSGDNFTYADGAISNNIIANESHISTLISVAGCDSIVTENINILPNVTNTVNTDLCTGGNHTYADGTVSTNILVNESHISTLVSGVGCDSVVTENLTVLPNVMNTENYFACAGSNFTYADGVSSSNITVSESHISILVSSLGCDSVLTENITIIPNITNTVNSNVCSGDNFTYADGTVSNNILVNESHVSILVSGAGCDSVLTENIIIIPNSTNTVNNDVCSGDNFTYADGIVSNNITANESHISTLVSGAGCDSVVTENITVNPIFNLTENVNACENSTYTYPDGSTSTITGNESHTSNLASVAGCDSTINTVLTMDPIVTNSVNNAICTGTDFTYADGTTSANITVAENHVSTLVSVAGCDSILTENITIIPNVTNMVSNDICIEADFTYADGTTSTSITANESHISILVSVAGCDSVLTENVNILPLITNTIAVSICTGSDFTYADGTTSTNILINESYVSILVSGLGCDSVVTENLIIVPIISNTINFDICSGTDFTYADGTTSTNITANENHVSNFVSVTGCDSIVTENLNVNPNLTTTINNIICFGTDFTYADGTTSISIIIDENHISTLASAAGCDSVVTENLTVIPENTNTINNDVCSGDNFTYADGTTSSNILVNETHISILVSTSGCDSTVTESNNINPVYNLSENLTACENSTYTYPDGSTSTITGNESHTSNLTTTAGCDSTINTILTMDPIVSNSVTSDICSGANFTYADGTISTNITVNENHISILASIAGCDSLLTENVNIVPAILVTNNNDLCSGLDFTYADGITSTGITVNENHISNLISISGCDSIITENIIILPVYNLISNISICEGETITYPDGVIAIISSSTIYTSTLITTNGCDSIIVTNVTMNPLPVFTLASTGPTSCGASDGTITLSGLNANTPYDVSYNGYTVNPLTSDASGNIIFTGLATGVYTDFIVVDANGCSTLDNTVINIAPLAAPSIDNILKIDLSCAGDASGEIHITASGGTGIITYEIDNGSGFVLTNTTGDFIGLSSGTYTLTITDATGCQSTDQVVINEPGNIIQNFASTDILCFGDANGVITWTSVTGGTSPYQYSIDNGVNYSLGTSFTGLSVGVYSIVVQDFNGCNSDTAEVVVFEPNELLISMSDVVLSEPSCVNGIPVCNGSIKINIPTGGGVAPFTYIWPNGIASPIDNLADNLCGNNYSIAIEDANGCSSSILVTLIDPTIPIIDDVIVQGAGCQNDCNGEVTVISPSATSFSLNGVFQNTGDFIGLCAGTYTIQVSNTQNCTSTESIIIDTDPVPLAQFIFDPGFGTTVESVINFDNLSEFATQYLWTIENIAPTPYYYWTTNEESFNHEFPSEIGEYLICLGASNDVNCADTVCQKITIRGGYTIYVPNAFTPDGDAYNQVFRPVLTGIDEQNYELLIFNRWGELIFESHNKDVGWDGMFQSLLVQDGVYVWQVTFKLLYTDERITKRGHVSVLR